MGTASLEFLVFALAAVALSNLSKAVLWRQSVLLLFSLAFLSFFSHDPAAWIPLAAFLAFGYWSVRSMQSARGPARFTPIVVAIIVAFVWLKKYAFVPAPLLLHRPYVTLGLSYIFFRVLHLVIDAHGGDVSEPVGIVSYLNYTLNFTTVISGPIQRYQDFAKYQLARTPLSLSAMAGGRAVERIVIGFFKVNVLSLAIYSIQAAALQALSSNLPIDRRIFEGALVVGSYPLYLYCNFSGYIDLVIGIARFLRIELPENFDRPFSSVNFMVFWSRWHITLSEWLKTYVYNPLLIALMRRYQSSSLVPYLGVFAIFVTFFLVGVWHGQTSEFLFFGVLQGAGVAAVQLYQVLLTQKLGKRRYKELSSHPATIAFSRGLTFTYFAATLLWFWSNWTQLGSLVHRLGLLAIAGCFVLIFVAATGLLWAWESARTYLLSVHVHREPLVLSRYLRTAYLTAISVIALVTVLILNAPAPDLVYKGF